MLCYLRHFSQCLVSYCRRPWKNLISASHNPSQKLRETWSWDDLSLRESWYLTCHLCVYPTLCSINMYCLERVTMELFRLKFTYPLIGAKLYKAQLSTMFCIWGHQSQTCLKFYVHGLENRCHLWREKRKQAVFSRGTFSGGPVCSSLEVEFSEQVVKLVIVIKDPNFDHITATDKLSTFNHLFLTKQLFIS